MIGIGGSTAAQELANIQPAAHLVEPIQVGEYRQRMAKACQMMTAHNIDVIYLHAGTNLYYFTGLRWRSSERMVGALLYADGTLRYIAPKFEEGTILDFMQIAGDILCWEEHESPYQRVVDQVVADCGASSLLAMDEATPFFVSNGLAIIKSDLHITDAKAITAGCRMIKSAAEIAIIQHAMDITLAVQKAAARILRVGITSEEVVDFIHEAHKRYGITTGSYFCIVLFGVDSSFPHGVKTPKALADGEVVLIDTGCLLHDYISDITRTYVYGYISKEQRRIWNIENQTQLAAFSAAQLGHTCSRVDDAARTTLVANGLGPDYTLPGLPHRTGHGIGLDIHEWPYIVRGDETVLVPGMCFSIEPMICIPDQFGIRLEDHVYMTEDGPRWFTQPMHSIEDPFGAG
jgi:Xaa-Pro dipeptidase